MKTLKEIYQANEELNYIDSSLYSRYRVKAGLRNDNGTGVKVGLTKICDVIGYKFVHEKKFLAHYRQKNSYKNLKIIY